MPLPDLLSLARDALVGLTDLAYPPRCLGCGAVLADRQAPLCPPCCDAPERPAPGEVRAALARLPAAAAISEAEALWVFQPGGIVQEVQHLLKYRSRPAVGVWLGRLVAEVCPVDAEVVVPVPLHRVRLYERGYNQAEALAEGLASERALPHAPHALTRTRATETQTALHRDARWRNVDGAFAVRDPAAIAGRRVLLMDDVLTTGATLTAAAHALISAGATAVDVAALAYARR